MNGWDKEISKLEGRIGALRLAGGLFALGMIGIFIYWAGNAGMSGALWFYTQFGILPSAFGICVIGWVFFYTIEGMTKQDIEHLKFMKTKAKKKKKKVKKDA